MEAQVGRRLFMGTVAAGLPLLVSQNVAGQAHTHTTAKGGDAILEHLAREMAQVHNRVVQRGPRGEDARALAAALRTLKVYAPQVDLDGKVKKGVRSMVAKHGREQVLYAEPDRRRMRDELRRFGGQPKDDPSRVVAAADHATRVKVLDEMLTRGMSPALERLAMAFEEAATELERTDLATIRRVRRSTDCFQWYHTIQWLEIEAGIMCAAAIFIPAAATACAMLMASLAVYQTFYALYC